MREIVEDQSCQKGRFIVLYKRSRLIGRSNNEKNSILLGDFWIEFERLAVQKC